ncbi:MAG TPA: histone family protein [Candidatus Nanoarchaeia archaeon]|nr:histone family protein [Candidatus Nanoarchaeia archaeon]
MDNILPLAAMEKLLKKCGAGRVSEDAKQAMKEVLESYGEKIGEYAVKIAQHSGRKTIKGTDVKLAVK